MLSPRWPAHANRFELAIVTKPFTVGAVQYSRGHTQRIYLLHDPVLLTAGLAPMIASGPPAVGHSVLPPSVPVIFA